MMTNDALESSGSMLLSHEMNTANGATSLAGQHSILNHNFNDQLHHGSPFTQSAGGGFNGYHSSFHTYPSLSSSSSAHPTFSNLIHQQMNNSQTSSFSETPLIHQLYTKSSNDSDIKNEATLESTVSVMKEEVCDPVIEDERTKVPADEVPPDEPEPESEVDIVIRNVVCAFSVRYPLALKEIALKGANVEFKRENGMVTMKLRKPYTTASIWSSGKITCTGATSEEEAKIAARRYARLLQKLNFKVKFRNYRVVNVLATCKMPWAIKVIPFSEKHRKDASYEPELHPGVTYLLKNPTATLKIFTTGSMTVTARCVADVQAAIEHIYPLVHEFRSARTTEAAAKEENLEEDLSDDDDMIIEEEDPLHIDEEPPSKKPKIHDVSHLQKRYKGGKSKKKRPKRPLGKMNDPSEDLIYVSDGDFDGDDPDAL